MRHALFVAWLQGKPGRSPGAVPEAPPRRRPCFGAADGLHDEEEGEEDGVGGRVACNHCSAAVLTPMQRQAPSLRSLWPSQDVQGIASPFSHVQGNLEVLFIILQTRMGQAHCSVRSPYSTLPCAASVGPEVSGRAQAYQCISSCAKPSPKACNARHAMCMHAGPCLALHARPKEAAGTRAPSLRARTAPPPSGSSPACP